MKQQNILFNRKLLSCGLSLILAGSLLVSCKQIGQQNPSVPELLDPIGQQVDSYVVDRRDIYSLVAYETDVLPTLLELSFGSSGAIEKFYCEVGDEVKAGDVLASLEGSSNQLDALNTQYENMLAQNDFNNRLTEINIEIAKLRGEDTSRSELVYSQTKEMQALELKNLEKQIEKAKVTLLAAEIIAPCDGVVVSLINTEESSAITAKSPAIAIATKEAAYVTCEYLSQSEVDAFDELYLTVDDCNYALTYIPYEPEALAAAVKAGTTISTFRVEGCEPDSLIGRYGVIYTVSNKVTNVIAVPINALYKEESSYYVYVLDGDSRIQTPVEVGIRGAMFAEIKSGISEGVSIYVKE